MPTSAEWRASYGTPEYRVYRTARRYRMTVEEYNEKLTVQNYRCYICSTKIDQVSANVDHDPACCGHSSKKSTCGKCTRSLLCHPCNIAVGHIENVIYFGHFDKILAYLGHAANDPNYTPGQPIKAD